MAGPRQTNFGGGELDPRLWGRKDLKVYSAGARVLENFIPTHHGSLMSRPGTFFVNRTKFDQKARLIPFNYADANISIVSQNYVLEFTEGCIRFHTALGTLGTTSPYEVSSPYVEADLPYLKYVQIGDTVIIACANHPVMVLARHAALNWTLTTFDVPNLAPAAEPLTIEDDPSHYPAIDTAHPGRVWEWMAVDVYPDGRWSAGSPITRVNQTTDSTNGMAAIYQDRTIKLWRAPRPGASRCLVFRGRNGAFGYVGDAKPGTIVIQSGATKDNGLLFIDEGHEPDFTINPPDTSIKFYLFDWYPAKYVNVGEWRKNGTSVYEAIRPGLTANSIITPATGPTGTGTDIVDGCDTVYLPNHTYSANVTVINRGFVYITSNGGPSGAGPGPIHNGGIADVNGVHWTYLGAGSAVHWKYVGEADTLQSVYPATVAIFEQRMVFGGTGIQPNSIFLSKPDDYHNFSKPVVSTVTEGLKWDLASRRREQIRSLVGLRQLMTLTNSSEWIVSGAANGDPMSPNSIRSRVQSEHGSSWVDPVVIGDVLIHIQPKGTIVRDMFFDVNKDSYVGNELSIFSQHFFRGHSVKSWSFAEDPYSVVWAAREDGKLLSMTYVKDQDLFAWAGHTRDGLVEQVCSIPEGYEDSVYLVVYRHGTRCIERMATREVTDAADAHCVDSGVVGTPGSLVVTGLDHLPGKKVVALVDGDVVGPLTVSGGSVTLPRAGQKIHVGLPYTCSFESLDVQVDSEKQKIVKEVLVDVTYSKGMWVGESLDDLSSWTAWPQRQLAAGLGSVPLSTGTARVTVSGRWGLGGRVAVQQRDPLPLTIVAIQREMAVGGS